MNTKKGVNKVVFAVHVLLVVYCILCCNYTVIMGTGGGGQQVPAIVAMAALCSTLYYMFSGYKKSAAKSYKLMMILCGAVSLTCLFPHTYNSVVLNESTFAAAICSMGYAVGFGLYLMLAFVPDLGKTKSMIILAVIFCAYLSVLIFSIVNQPGVMISDSGTRYDSMRIMRHTTTTVLAANAAVCTYFKYEDKSARGSK